MKRNRLASSLRYLKSNWIFYAMMMLPVLYYILFHYLPMYGLTIAFKDYNMFKGISGSKWVGLKVFENVLKRDDFFRAVKNTLILNVGSLIIVFPAPILLALMLNEFRNGLFKKLSQTILYLPHFISWVIIGGMVYQVFSNNGIVNSVLLNMFGITIPFLTDGTWWVITYYIVSVWSSVGWGAIIYMSAITGIDSEIYEAAKVDGASRLRMMFSITLPNIRSTVVIMLILRIGSMASIGFEQPLTIQNSAVMEVADVLSTYIYRVGTQNSQFSIAAAVGFAQSLINFMLVLGANTVSNKLTGEGIW